MPDIFDDFGLPFTGEPSAIGEPKAPTAEHPQRQPDIFDDFDMPFIGPTAAPAPTPAAPAAPAFEPVETLSPYFDPEMQQQLLRGPDVTQMMSLGREPDVLDDFGLPFMPDVTEPEIREGNDDWISMQTLDAAWRGTAAGGIDLLATTPATMIEMLGREIQERNIAEIAGDYVRFMTLFTPIVGDIMAQPVEKLVGWMTRTEEGEDPGAIQQAIGDMIGDVGETARKFWGEKAEKIQPDAWWKGKSVFDNPEVLKSPTWWLFNTTRMGVNLAATIIPGAGVQKAIKGAKWASKLNPRTFAKLSKLGDAVVRNAQKSQAGRLARWGGMAAGGATGGMLESSNTYTSVREAGGTHEEALRSAQLMFWATTGLNALSLGKWLNEPAKKVSQRMAQRVGRGTWEALTEGAEEPAEAISMMAAKIENGEVPEDMIGEFLDSLKQSLDVMPPSIVLGLFAPLGGEAQSRSSIARARRIFGRKEQMKTTTGKEIAGKDLDIDQLQQTRDGIEAANPQSEVLDDMDKLMDLKVKDIQVAEALQEIARERAKAPTPTEEVAAAIPEERLQAAADQAVEEGKHVSESTGEIITLPEGQGARMEDLQDGLESMGGRRAEVQPAIILNDEQQRIHDVADGLGVGVTFYDAMPGSVGDGINGTNFRGHIFINRNAIDPMVAVLGHESFHQLFVDDRDSFNRLMNVIEGTAKNLGEYTQRINTARTALGQTPLSEREVLEEFAADVVGEQFTKATFWRNIQKAEPTVGEKLAKAVLRLIDKVRGKYKSGAEVDQAARVEAAIAEVYGEMVQRRAAARDRRARVKAEAEREERRRERMAAKIKDAEEILKSKEEIEADVIKRTLDFFWDMYDAGEISAKRLIRVLEAAQTVKLSVKTAVADDFLKTTPTSVRVPITEVVNTEPDLKREKIERAKVFMLQALTGRMDKRSPINLYKRQSDGKLAVVDGNSTVTVLREFGVPDIIAEVDNKPYQAKVNTLDESYKLAEAVKRDMISLINRLAKQYDAKVLHRPGLKKRSRAQEKVEHYGHPRYIKDIIGSTLVLPTQEEIRIVAESVGRTQPVLEIEDRLAPTDDGYNDMVALVRMPNGYFGELLLIEEAVQQIKGIDARAPGHRLFEVIRMLDTAADKDGVEGALEVANKLNAVSKKLYDRGRALDLKLDLARAFAVPSDITRDLLRILEDPATLDTSISLSPSKRKILDEFVSYLKGIPSLTTKRIAIVPFPPFNVNLLQDPADVKRKIMLSVKKPRVADMKVWRRKLENLGPDVYSIYEAGLVRMLTQVKERKWTVPFEDTQFGKVNNRLSRELDVVEQIFGESPLAQTLPVKTKGLPARSITSYDLLLELFRRVDNGDLAQVMDRTKSIKEVAIERGIKGARALPAQYKGTKKEAAKMKKLLKQGKLTREAWGFQDKVYMLREGKLYREVDEGGADILARNGKAGKSTDLMLATCHPTTPCRECYAAGFTRQSIVNKAVRNTLHLMADPKGWARAVAAEAASIPKAELPFLRLQGSGDMIMSEQVTAYNEMAKHADRPIHIFSRNHDMLRKLKGTANAPFLKIGSLDIELFKHYGMRYLKDNMTKHGIMNAWLYLDESEIPSIQKLMAPDEQSADGYLALILAADDKLHGKLPVDAQARSCPCDADERGYQQSCRQCALSQLGCYLSFKNWAIDEKGKLWRLDNPKLPRKAYPVLQFFQDVQAPDGWSAEAFGYSLVVQDIIAESIRLAKMYRRQMRDPKHKRTQVPLKDVRFPDDVVYVKSEKRIEAWIRNMELISEAAGLGTFYLPGGLIQPPVAFKNGVKLADATVISDEDAKNLAFASKLSIKKYPVGKTMPGAVYVHRSSEGVLPNVEEAKRALPTDWDYDVVKYNEKTKGYTFIQSPDFMTADEPTVGDGILVRADGTTRKIAQAADPWIYHHKWMMVDDKFTGFDVRGAKRRSEAWTGLRDVDRARIGKRSYWEKNVAPRIPAADRLTRDSQLFKYEQMKKSNDSARSSGAVGPRARVPRVVMAMVDKGKSILDFGAGDKAEHTLRLRKAGYKNVSAHEFGINYDPTLHDPAALEKTFDVVFASNVMNTQDTVEMFEMTAKQLYPRVKKDGMLIVNMPSDPRYGFLEAMTPKEARDYMLRSLNDNFEDVTTARLDGKNRPEIFVARRPRKIKLKVKNQAMFISNLPTFKRWFGKSIAKEDDVPIIMFHGTRSTFAEFNIKPGAGMMPRDLYRRLTRLIDRRDKLQAAMMDETNTVAQRREAEDFWLVTLDEINKISAQDEARRQSETARSQAAFFIDDPGYASRFSEPMASDRETGQPNVMPVFLKLENPADVGNVDAQVLLPELEKRTGVKFKRLRGRWMKAGVLERELKQHKTVWQWYTFYTDIFQEIQKAGHDGIIGTEAGHKMMAVFKPTQVKSLFNRGTFDVYAKDISLSIKKDVWYSQMEKVLEEDLPGKGTGASYLQTINSWVKKGKFKPEEWEWSGLIDILEAQPKTKYEKEVILEILRDNNIRVEEIVLRSPGEMREVRDATVDRIQPQVFTWASLQRWGNRQMSAFESRWEDVTQTYIIDNDNGPLIDFMEEINEQDDVAEAFPLTNIEENAGRRFFYNRQARAEQDFIDQEEGARHMEYTVDGGEQYHELLITLAERWRPRFQNFAKKMIDKYQWSIKNATLRDFGKKEFTNRILGGWMSAQRDLFEMMSKQEAGVFNMLDKMADQEKLYIGPRAHFGDEPNIISFVRFNTRQDDQGRKVLFIEELQSDWHQDGFKKGYGTLARKDFRVEDISNQGDRVTSNGRFRYKVYGPNDRFVSRVETKEDVERYIDEYIAKETVADGPFKKTWVALGLKRMVRWAAEHDYDAIAWTPGEIQVQRYNLRHHLSEIRYRQNDDGTWRLRFYDLQGKFIPHVRTNKNIDAMTDKEMVSFLGKTLSERIISGEGEALTDQSYDGLTIGDVQQIIDGAEIESWRSLKDKDLEVGGKGLARIYDKKIVNEANRVFNKAKWGKAKVATTTFPDTPVSAFTKYVGPNADMLATDPEFKAWRNQTRDAIYKFVGGAWEIRWPKEGALIDNPGGSFQFFETREQAEKVIENINKEPSWGEHSGFELFPIEDARHVRTFALMRSEGITFGEAVTRTKPWNMISAISEYIENADIEDLNLMAWVLPVTPEMKEKALQEGMPKFSIKDLSTNQHSVLRQKQIASIAKGEALDALAMNERGIPFWREFMDRRPQMPVKEARREYEELYGPLKKVTIAGSEQMIGMREQQPMFMVKAWHGSPYAFDLFTTEAIGSGEGAAAFGWGLYFTELRNVAEWYAKKLTKHRQDIFIGGMEVSEIVDKFGPGAKKFNAEARVRGALDRLLITRRAWLMRAGPEQASLPSGGKIVFQTEMTNLIEALTAEKRFADTQQQADEFQDAIDFINNVWGRINQNQTLEIGKKMKKNRALYRVALHDGKDPSEYTWLDWYEYVPQETIEKIEKAHGQKLLPEAFRTGETIYRELSEFLGSKKDASLFLLKAGIDGIRYPVDSLSGRGPQRTRTLFVDGKKFKLNKQLGHWLNTGVNALTDIKSVEQFTNVFNREFKGMMRAEKGLQSNVNELLKAIREGRAEIRDTAPKNYVVFDEQAVTVEERIMFSSKKSQDQIAADYLDMLETSTPTEGVTGPATAANILQRAPKEVQQRIAAAKIRKPPWMQRLQQKLLDVKQSFLRSRPYLDPKTQGDVLNILRIHQEVPENARRRAMEVLDNIVGDLTEDQYSTLSLAIIMDDMMKDLETGLLSDDEGLPFGFKDRKEAKAYRDQVFDVIRRDKKLSDAFSRRMAVNRKLKEILVKYGLLDEKVLEDDRYFHHQVMMYREANSLGEQFGLTTVSQPKRLQQKKAGWQKARTGSILDYNTDYAQSEFEVMSQAFVQLETVETLNRLKAAADQTATLKEMAKANKLYNEQNPDEKPLETNWEKLIPPGFVQWSPAPGSSWYRANSITDRILMDVLGDNTVISAENAEEVVKATWARGRDPRWVISEGLAKTLNEFSRGGEDNVLGTWSRWAMTKWKQWILINPFRIFKYNLNNMSGDLDIALAYDPRILGFFNQARKDLWADWRRKEVPADLRADLELARRMGVIGSGWSVQEVTEVTKELNFKQFSQMMNGERPDLLQRLLRSPKVAWRTSKDFTAFRENILRLAAFRFFRQEVIDKGRTDVYGASNKFEIDQIARPMERAAKLARDLIGDYGNISDAGMWIRAHMLPFYSWLEVNAPRYVRLMRNLKHEDMDVVKYSERASNLKTAVARRAVWKGAFLAVKASMIMLAVNIWNRFVFPDEEDELTESQRRQQHIILGRNKDGSVRTLRFQGAFSDALNWFGMENPWHDIEMLVTGKVTINEQLKESFWAGPIKVVQGFRPDVKSVGEAIAGYSLYPDPFSPRPIRDRVDHIARMFSMDKIWRAAVGRPRRGETWANRLWHDVMTIGLYESDPGEGAYYQTKAWMYTWLDRNDIERSSARPTSRANAMYYYRQALKFGDLPAARRYLKKYYELGGSYRGLKQSIKRAHPLAGMNAKDRRRFLKSLNERQREVIDMALEWYYKTYVRGRARRVGEAGIRREVRQKEREQRNTLRKLRGQ